MKKFHVENFLSLKMHFLRDPGIFDSTLYIRSIDFAENSVFGSIPCPVLCAFAASSLDCRTAVEFPLHGAGSLGLVRLQDLVCRVWCVSRRLAPQGKISRRLLPEVDARG